MATTGGVEVGAAPSHFTAIRSSSAFGQSTAPPGNFQYDSKSPGPAVGEKREEKLPLSSQERPVVVKCLVKIYTLRVEVVPPPLAFGSVCVVETRQPLRVSASV